MDLESFQKQNKLAWNILLALVILEGLFAEIALLTIPRDVKNARFWGFSPTRLILIIIIFLLLIFFIGLLTHKKAYNFVIKDVLASSLPVRFARLLGFFSIFFLWLILWIPASRLGKAEAAFVRMQPFLLWIGLIGTQSFFFIQQVQNQLGLGSIRARLGRNKKLILVSAITVLVFGLVFLLLRLFSHQSTDHLFFFPPGAPLSSLQVFLSGLLLLFLWMVEGDPARERYPQKVWTWMLFAGLWLIAIVALMVTPLKCTDDRPGPFPPNYICYPQINDAVYSIGSHYITLGEGIYHNWGTDKPLYMIFLALGQEIFGPVIDRYLIFQIIVLALIPPFLFLLGKRMLGFAGGLFLGALGLIQEINALTLYSQTGSVNVKFENPELLVALLLILLCFALTRWYQLPDKKHLAMLSGGILGFATLVRFNAIFIVPLVMIVYGIANRANVKRTLIHLCLFFLAFLLAFLPLALGDRDSSGSSYYVAKIKNVIGTRITAPVPSQLPEPQTLPSGIPTVATPLPTSPAENPSTGLVYPSQEVQSGGASGLWLHLLNNGFSSLAKLPTLLSFQPLQEQVQDEIWNFNIARPIWKVELSPQNVFALLINLFLGVLGVVLAAKKWGLAGFSALIIQIGYHIGNAAAATSGGRYLEPVIWVTLLYYAIGISAVASLFINLVFNPSRAGYIQSLLSKEVNPETQKHEDRKAIYALVGILAIGLLINLSNHLPAKMPEQSGDAVNQKAFQSLSENSAITAAQWQAFLADPMSLVVEGIGYHPRYYRSSFFLPGTPSFETMVLGKQNVIISYMVDVTPTDYFSDSSDVILVGCKLADDALWGANRTIMRTYALFQLDHEKNSYIAGSNLPDCSNKD